MPQDNHPSIQQLVRQEIDRAVALAGKQNAVAWASILQDRLDAEDVAGRAANAPADVRHIAILGIFRTFYEELHTALNKLQSN